MEKTRVADTDALDLAAGDEGLHLLPCLGVVPVADHVARAIGVGGELVVVSYR